MSDVIMPQQRQRENNSGKLLMLGGAALGAVNPAMLGASGALAGAGAGAGLGSTAGAIFGGNQKQKAEVPAVQSTAMQRRMASMEPAQQNVAALREADSALMTLPPAQAAQYAPAIKKARSLAEQEIA
jgi:uncharacterized protein YcfJ